MKNLNATLLTIHGRTHKILIANTETFTPKNFTADTIWRFMSRDKQSAIIILGANIETIIIEQQ